MNQRAHFSNIRANLRLVRGILPMSMLLALFVSACGPDGETPTEVEGVAEVEQLLAAPTNTSAFATAVLAKHNSYRTNTSLQSVGLPPANPPLLMLTWNQTRANSAQLWAEQLGATGVMQHSGGPGYGENIYVTMSSSPISTCSATKSALGTAASTAWGNESLNPAGNWTGPYSVFPFQPTGPLPIGHYTQMIWGAQGGFGPTTSVGCGIAPGVSPSPAVPFACYVVCQYTAPGNVHGVHIYARGEACNGVDDNGNGQVDENNPGGGVSCNVPNTYGACVKGVTKCSNGSLVCQSTLAPAPELCNNIDDDCDGVVDEDNPEGGTPCMLDGLTAEMTCVNGSVICTYPSY